MADFLIIIIPLILFFIFIIFLIGGIIPVYKLGIPLYFEKFKWTWFIYKNRKNWILLNEKPDWTSLIDNSNYFRIDKKTKKYIIHFRESWLFEVYKGSSVDDIKFKYPLGGQSNKAEYLTQCEKKIGRKIEQYYKDRYINKRRYKLKKILNKI